LFVALVPPADALAELEAAVAPHRPDWPALSWAHQDRWHLTLAFLGTVPEQILPELDTRLTRVAAANPSLGLALAGSGTFPAHGPATVLWTGIDGARVELIALAGSVNAAARRAGAADTDPKRMHPHLTLARAHPPADLTGLREQLGKFHGTPWRAGEIRLVRSRQGAGPRYQTLSVHPLNQ
jgi:2'-5' RNA ligase